MAECRDCEHRAVSAADWTNQVTNLLLFLILIVLLAQLFDSHKRADFSKENEVIKEATKKASDELQKISPQNKSSTKGKKPCQNQEPI